MSDIWKKVKSLSVVKDYIDVKKEQQKCHSIIASDTDGLIAKAEAKAELLILQQLEHEMLVSLKSLKLLNAINPTTKNFNSSIMN